MGVPSSLSRDISPPPPLKRRKTWGYSPPSSSGGANLPIKPTLAAVEAGRAKINDHLAYFRSHLAKASRITPPEFPRLSIPSFLSLYQSNQHQHGHHFVIHQHNHPRAGVHYDLRLQFSESSSMSFAVPKGLPGNPNSRSIGRMAIETRVHNYWNHLIESASSKTGSLLIWDTGTYEVLSRKKKQNGKKRAIPSPQTTDDESDDSDSDPEAPKPTRPDEHDIHDNEKLIAAFQTRYIRIRLHGTKLPKNYTIILRLPDNETTKRPTARRKSRKSPKTHMTSAISTDSEDEPNIQREEQNQEQDLDTDTDTDEDTETRFHNAYPGSTNDIGSIHQRHWFLMLDRQSSGFVLDQSGGGKGKWVRTPDGGGVEPFFVRGRDHERSVVTGRLARDVECDEGVESFVGRGGWVGIEH
jgi:hypothetical protein